MGIDKGQKICVLCGKIMSVNYFSRSDRNEKFHDNVGFCRSCISEKVDTSSQDSVVDMLRMMNLPFIPSAWKQAEGILSSSQFGAYLQIISHQNRKFPDFLSSDLSEHVDKEVGDAEMAKWGHQETEEDYRILEAIYKSLAEIKKPNGRFEEDRYVQAAKLKKLLDEALDSGDYKAVKDVRRAYEDELKSLNLDTKSETEEMTIGQRIEQYEEHDPIPKPDKELLDVDGVQKYITSNFLYPVKRMFGLATEEEEQQIYEHDGYDGSDKVIEKDK